MKRHPRITAKFLVNWCNDKFKQLEINDYEVYGVNRTHFTPDQYQCGACFLHILFRKVKDHDVSGCFYSFYSMGDLYNHVFDNKYELYFSFKASRGQLVSLHDLELDVRKI